VPPHIPQLHVEAGWCNHAEGGGDRVPPHGTCGERGCTNRGCSQGGKANGWPSSETGKCKDRVGGVVQRCDDAWGMRAHSCCVCSEAAACSCCQGDVTFTHSHGLDSIAICLLRSHLCWSFADRACSTCSTLPILFALHLFWYTMAGSHKRAPSTPKRSPKRPKTKGKQKEYPCGALETSFQLDSAYY
jgi:hypothetical protein